MSTANQVYSSLTTKQRDDVNFLLMVLNNSTYEKRNKKETFYKNVKKGIYKKVKFSRDFRYSIKREECKDCVQGISNFCRMMRRKEGHKNKTRFLFQRKKISQLIGFRSEIVEEGRRLKLIPRYKSQIRIVISLKVWSPSLTRVNTIPNDDQHEENMNFSS